VRKLCYPCNYGSSDPQPKDGPRVLPNPVVTGRFYWPNVCAMVPGFGLLDLNGLLKICFATWLIGLSGPLRFCVAFTCGGNDVIARKYGLYSSTGSLGPQCLMHPLFQDGIIPSGGFSLSSKITLNKADCLSTFLANLWLRSLSVLQNLVLPNLSTNAL